MNDQELCQAVADRLRKHEAVCAATDNVKRLRKLKRVHALLERAWKIAQPEMGLAPLSGGGPKVL